MAIPEEPPIPPDEAAIPAAAPEPTATGSPSGPPRASARLDWIDRREPLYRECRGYRLRLAPADLARLRELPGSRGKSDEELGESFFDTLAEKLVASVAGDVPEGAELRVVVDPYTRQAFVALDSSIRGILSF